jgi:hypothetical protein
MSLLYSPSPWFTATITIPTTTTTTTTTEPTTEPATRSQSFVQQTTTHENDNRHLTVLDDNYELESSTVPVITAATTPVQEEVMRKSTFDNTIPVTRYTTTPHNRRRKINW